MLPLLMARAEATAAIAKLINERNSETDSALRAAAVQVCLSIYALSVCLCVCPSVYASVLLSVRLSFCLCVCPSVYASVRLYVLLSVFVCTDT
jgi:hypothetical protein